MSKDDKKAPSFVLAAPAAFWWPVVVPIPVDNDYAQAELDVLFQPVDQDELDLFQGLTPAAQQPADEGQPPAVPPPVPTDAQIAQRVVRGWRRVTDARGEPLPFTPENLKALLRAPMARTALVATYMAVMRGLAARKNG